MKKMKKNIFYMIACGVMVLAAAACSKEQANNEPQEEPAGLITESFSAQKENEATKVTMNSSRVFGWSSSDKAAFSIYNDGTSSYDFVESGFYGTPIANKFTVSYTGTRQGYAVIPSTFAKSLSADGNTLTVTYPDSYDISADVDAGTYDNADGAHFIPFPMVAVSDPSSSALTFRSIGALVKVVVSHVPAGTKNLYVTFNQTVTGDFVVSGPDTMEPTVSVSDTSTPSTITVKISEDGLDAEQTITLYIPVPTTTNLCIASVAPANKKSTVARNYGYQFTCDAISRVDTTTEFQLSPSYDYILSPGNLWAHKTGEGDDDIEYFFPTGMDQLKTTSGAFTNNPHLNNVTPMALPTVASVGEYQDIFKFSELYKLIKGSAMVDDEAAVDEDELLVDCPKTINGSNKWRVATTGNGFSRFFGVSRSKKSTVYVRGLNAKLIACVDVNLLGTIYANYALWDTYVSGRLIFPDGYVDMTDAISENALNDLGDYCTISYNALEKMIGAGAYFLIQGGIYYDGAYHVTNTTTGGTYLLGQQAAGSAGVMYYDISKFHNNFSLSGHKNTYRPVRMYTYKKITP